MPPDVPSVQESVPPTQTVDVALVMAGGVAGTVFTVTVRVAIPEAPSL